MGQILVGRLFSLIWHECGSCVVLSWWQGWSQDPSPHIPGALAAMAQLGPYSLHPLSRLLFIISPVRQSDFSTEHMETASPFRPDLDQGMASFQPSPLAKAVRGQPNSQGGGTDPHLSLEGASKKV